MSIYLYLFLFLACQGWCFGLELYTNHKQMELKYPSGETKVWNFNRRDQLESMMTKISSLSHAPIGYGRPLAGGKRTRDSF